MVHLRTEVENVTQHKENFVKMHGQRIDGALKDYLDAVSQQFAETELEMEKKREEMHEQFSGTMKIMEDKVRLEIQNMFYAQSLENGFLWQNLVNACNQNFATTLNAYVETLAPKMHAQVHEKIAQHTAVFQGRLAESTAHLKTWFAKELISFDKGVYTKVQRIEANQGEIRALVASAWEGQRVSGRKMENMRK